MLSSGGEGGTRADYTQNVTCIALTEMTVSDKMLYRNELICAYNKQNIVGEFNIANSSKRK